MSTKLISLRIEENLLSVISNRASKENRTVSNMIVSILLSSLTKDERCSICKHSTDLPIGCTQSEIAYLTLDPNGKCNTFQIKN